MDNDTEFRVVLDDRRYVVERPWEHLPSGTHLGVVSSLALDPDGFVYVCHREGPGITVFDADGGFVARWGDEVLFDPHGIFITPDRRLLLADRDAHQIVVFSLDGRVIGRLGERGQPRFQAPFNHPTAAAVARDGEIYVTDGYANSVVHRFSPTGKLIQTWGRPGTGPGEFCTPHAVWIDRSNRVLVADRENNRIQIFDRDGNYTDEWTDFYHPMDIFEDDRGMVFVSDQIPRLSMLTPDGRLVGRCRPVLNIGHGIWGNARGDLFLAEMNPMRVTKMRLI